MMISRNFRRIFKTLFSLDRQNAIVNLTLEPSYDKKSIYSTAEQTNLRAVAVVALHACLW
jgi:hypothetical protein